jgi:PRTRC genetic system protein C
MLTATALPRVFIHTENNQEIRLPDPAEKLSVDAVKNFYAPTYPILTTARVEGPEIIDDEIVYRFVSSIGTKG